MKKTETLDISQNKLSLRQYLFGRFALVKPIQNSCVFDSCAPRPFSGSKCYTVVRYPDTIAFVIGLFVPVRPSAVFRSIAFVVINTFNRMIDRWSESHVIEEIIKTEPSVADSDSSTSVFRKVFSIGIKTPAFHTIPYSVFSRMPHAVFRNVFSVFVSGRFFMQTPTRFCVSVFKHSCSDNSLVSTITLAKPLRVTGFRIFNALYHTKSGKLLAGDIGKIMGRHRYLLNRFRCLGEQRAQPLLAANYTGRAHA
jgi:hypothetical protein